MKHYLALAIWFVFKPVDALANAGVPMLFVTLPAMLTALIPVITIEAYVLRKRLSLSLVKSTVSSAIANVLSTLVGIPLAWIALVAVQMTTAFAVRVVSDGEGIALPEAFQRILFVIWQSPWLMPSESDYSWLIPTAMLVFLIPCFVVSWKSECLVIRMLNKQIDTQEVKSTSFEANLISYSLFALYPISMLIDQS